jgi:transposase-like protein
MEQHLPTTLLECVTYFNDGHNCVEFVKSICWPDGTCTCPRCESTNCLLLEKQQRWMCRDCRKQFSIKYNTIFEKSPLPLSKWLVAMWLVCNAKNGISSHELSRAIGVTQKSTWFMLHRIREAMRTGTFKKLSGVVEVDESYVGGSDTNRHMSKKRNVTGRQHDQSKTPVIGMMERGGNVVAHVINDASENTLHANLKSHVEAGSVLYSDQWTAYRGLHKHYFRDTVNHSKKQFVKGDAHTNTIEGYWSLFKRAYKGTWIHVAPFHLDRYLDEQSFRYNERKTNDGTRIQSALVNAYGRRLTWKELTAQSL